MDSMTYYASQSPFTDPCEYEELFSVVPDTAQEMCKLIQTFCLDHQERFKYPIVNERLLETNLRYVSDVLKWTVALDSRALNEERAIDAHFLASSSIFSALLCSMLRFKGIPARKRVGFATYFPNTKHGAYRSHEVVEYWDAAGKTWRLADASLDEVATNLNEITFDICDVPRDKFISAGAAWQMAREGKVDAELFRDEETKGYTILRSNLIHDLGAINKREVLNWDHYGWALWKGEAFGDAVMASLDRLAELLQKEDALDELQAMYNTEEGLQVPNIVVCDNPDLPVFKSAVERYISCAH